MTTLQRVQKYRADTQKYLNERKREILRYSKKNGTFPQAEKWRLYGFTVGQIAKVIEEGGHTPDYSKIPIEYRLDDEGKPLPDQYCVDQDTTDSGGSDATRVTMNIPQTGRMVADMIHHNEDVTSRMEGFVSNLPPEETLIADDADNYRTFQDISAKNRGRQFNINPAEIYTITTINEYLHRTDDSGRMIVIKGDAKSARMELKTVENYVGKKGKPQTGAFFTCIKKYSPHDCYKDVRDCYKDMKTMLDNMKKDVNGKTGEKMATVGASTKVLYCQALYFVAHHFKRDRSNEGVLEKQFSSQMTLLEEERKRYVKIRDAEIRERMLIPIEPWSELKRKWLNDGDRLDIENVFFELYEESVGRDDFGRVFVNPDVNIESDQWGLGGNNFMTKDTTTGDWTFHLNKYKTYNKFGVVKILWRGEKAKLIDDWLKISKSEKYLFERNTNSRIKGRTPYGSMSTLIGNKLKRLDIKKIKFQNINYLRHSYASTGFDWEYFRKYKESREDTSFTMLHSASMNPKYVRPLISVTKSLHSDARQELEEDQADSNIVIPEESIPSFIASRTRSKSKATRGREEEEEEEPGRRKRR